VQPILAHRLERFQTIFATAAEVDAAGFVLTGVGCGYPVVLSLCLGLILRNAFSFFASIPANSVTLAKPANPAKQKRD
jgi:hypothetical protein